MSMHNYNKKPFDDTNDMIHGNESRLQNKPLKRTSEKKRQN